MKAAELFVRCLENEGVQAIFGLPGEENVEILDVLLDSPIRFISTRHEQGAAFMADVYGRLTGRAGVCLATLAPGATNLVTGVADANMDHAPVVAIAGQSATTRLHKESHQHLDLVNLFRPISKYSIQILEPETIPEVVRKAFKQAQAEKPGVSFIDFPENIAEMEIDGKSPVPVQHFGVAVAPGGDHPPGGGDHLGGEVSADPGRQRRDSRRRHRALGPLCRAVEHSGGQHVHGQGRDAVLAPALARRGRVVGPRRGCGFDRADVIVCVGYDMVEYHPNRWHPDKSRQVIHVDVTPAEVDEHYVPDVEVVGDIGAALDALALQVKPQKQFPASLWHAIMDELSAYADDASFPLKPQRIVWDLQRALASCAKVICDVGGTKSGWPACISPSGPTPASSATVSHRWALPCRARLPPVWRFPRGRWWR